MFDGKLSDNRQRIVHVLQFLRAVSNYLGFLLDKPRALAESPCSGAASQGVLSDQPPVARPAQHPARGHAANDGYRDTPV
ncbi:hypothetical protein, partial [Pseudomonas syringae]|uniref:hypothetical protein n=1 Tax=Pseudomonas syringae TaxID=317 RepID=UPI001E2A6003